jgi:nitroreductase
MPPEDLRHILALGVQAPSGDNLQPWRFEVNGTMVSVFGVFNDQKPLADRIGTIISCGAAIENMVIAAHTLGYQADVTYKGDATGSDYLADMRFTETGGKSDAALCAEIPKRTTNRKRFSKARLVGEERQALLASVLPFRDEVSLRITESRGAMRSIAHSLAINVRLFLEDPAFHRYFFGNLRWDTEDVAKTRDGIPVRALKLNPLEYLELKLMRSWPIARFFSRLGAARLAGQAYTDRYLSAGAFITILARGNSAPELLAGGRALERLWLTATHESFGVQPIAGFIMGQDASGLRGVEMVATNLQRNARQSYADIRKTLGLADETIVIILRVGKAKAIPGETLRKEQSAR